jgi:SNF2 family DNA or RNA helicase
LLMQRDEIDQMLVIAPKSMVSEWKEDLSRFMGSLYTSQIIDGNRQERRMALRLPADVMITNFETVISLEPEIAALLQMANDRALLVVDESFLIKNPGARRTRALRRVREWAGKAFVLCGTPAPNAPTDVVEQVNLADFGVTFEGVEIPDDRESALPVIRTALTERGVYLRSLKKDVLPDLPGKQLTLVRLPFEPRQGRTYDAALSSLVDDLREVDEEGFRKEITSFMARRTALLQICSNPSAVIEGYDEVPAKIKALDSLLKRWVSERHEKVVIWSFFTRSLEGIVRRFEHLGLVRYDGVTPINERREAVRRFQQDESIRIFVGNPAAAGAGLTLHAARLAVYESISNQAAHYLQSLDRIHRRGQERPVEYTFLVCEDSIEESSLEHLRLKERDAQELLGDPLGATTTRESLLADLLEGASSRSTPLRANGTPDNPLG